MNQTTFEIQPGGHRLHKTTPLLSQHLPHLRCKSSNFQQLGHALCRRNLQSYRVSGSRMVLRSDRCHKHCLASTPMNGGPTRPKECSSWPIRPGVLSTTTRVFQPNVILTYRTLPIKRNGTPYTLLAHSIGSGMVCPHGLNYAPPRNP